jgi:hypothetical protein
MTMNRVHADRQIRFMRWLGFAFVVGGFVAIGLGWNGMARRATFDEQIPYVLSGGIAGIGLIVLGIGLLLVAQIRSERQRLSTILDVMGPAAKKLAPKAETGPQASEPFLFHVRHVRMLSLVLVAGGFLAIGLGWNGMARTASGDEQFPFIVSGGALGIGLIVFGVGLLLVSQIRTERRQLMNVLEVMARAVSSASSGEAVETSSESAASDVLVVAGPSTFHRPDCRLVQGKPGLDRLTIEVAQSSGLSPCRVCDPLGGRNGKQDETLAETLVTAGDESSTTGSEERRFEP